jgi:hypothetical protein
LTRQTQKPKTHSISPPCGDDGFEDGLRREHSDIRYAVLLADHYRAIKTAARSNTMYQRKADYAIELPGQPRFTEDRLGILILHLRQQLIDQPIGAFRFWLFLVTVVSVIGRDFRYRLMASTH